MGMGDDAQVRRLAYASVPVGTASAADLDSILAQSRRNNGLNGVTGLLLAQPGRYVQVLEGAPEAVGFIMAKILADGRHRDIRILFDADEAERVFGGWTMAVLPGGGDEAEVRRRLERLLSDVPDEVRGAFPVI